MEVPNELKSDGFEAPSGNTQVPEWRSLEDFARLAELRMIVLRPQPGALDCLNGDGENVESAH